MDAGAFHWQFSLGRCSCSGFHDDLPKHSAALRSHSQMNISHSLFLPWEDEHEMSTPSSFTLFVYVTSNKMPNLNQQRCTHCRRWSSCWPHRSCSRKIRCRGCPRWASTWDAAWRRCNTGRALGSTLTVITQTFETSCTVAWWGITAPKYWPVQIVHGCARASVSAVAAVVGIVQGGPAIGHHTQNHFPELVEGPVVQRLTWKQEKQQELETLFKGHFRNVGRFLTDGEARSNEEHNLEGIHPGACQEAEPTSASLYIKRGTLVLLCQLFTLHVGTHTPKYTSTFREPTWTWDFGCVDYSVLEERQGWKHNNNKKRPWTQICRYSAVSSAEVADDAAKPPAYLGNGDNYHVF